MQMTNQFGDSKNAVLNYRVDFLFAVRAEDGIRKTVQTCAETFWSFRTVFSLYRIPFSEVDFRSTYCRGLCTVLVFSQSYLRSSVKTHVLFEKKKLYFQDGEFSSILYTELLKQTRSSNQILKNQQLVLYSATTMTAPAFIQGSLFVNKQ